MKSGSETFILSWTVPTRRLLDDLVGYDIASENDHDGCCEIDRVLRHVMNQVEFQEAFPSYDKASQVFIAK